MLGLNLLALAAFALPALAQNASAAASVPACSIACLTKTFPTSGCTSATNLTCICNTPSFQAAIYACEQTTCSPADLAASIAFGQASCGTLALPVNGTAASAAPAASSAKASSAAVASVAASSVKASVSAAVTASGSVAAPAASASKAASAGTLAVGGVSALVFGGLALLL
ncbi:hypothetical protein RQP46_005335 [Phenoliferia psychrophenolica]